MTSSQVRELLQHTADCLEIEARWWNNVAHSDSNNRDIGMFAKGIEIGYRRSAKWLNEQAAEFEDKQNMDADDSDIERRQPPDGLVGRAIREQRKQT